ncbi:MAG: ISNCY family transposase [Balneolaceae bacterium]
MGKIAMSVKELKNYRLAMEVIEGKLTIVDFAVQIGKSYRQAQRIIKRIKAEGSLGAIHGNTGKRPHNKTSEDLEKAIVDLLRNKYNNFNLTHFREKALELEDISIKKDALHTIARKHGLVKHPKRRGRRCHKPRPRLPNEGMMIQFDGSCHLWFGSRKTDLIAGIDDATGKVVAGEFFFGETSNNSLKVIREIIDKNGLPESFYMDQAAIYGKVEQEWESQISRAFEQTGIRLILAGSSQAKGRIERLWRTFQDRLIAELEFYGIDEIEEANTFLKETFIPAYNLQFAVEPEEKKKAYRKNVFGDLDIIFCKKVERKIMSGNVFSWENVTWQMEDKKCFMGRRININIHLDGNYSFDVMGRKVQCRVSKRKRINDYGNRSKLRKSA